MVDGWIDTYLPHTGEVIQATSDRFKVFELPPDRAMPAGLPRLIVNPRGASADAAKQRSEATVVGTGAESLSTGMNTPADVETLNSVTSPRVAFPPPQPSPSPLTLPPSNRVLHRPHRLRPLLQLKYGFRRVASRSAREAEKRQIRELQEQMVLP